jgi:hypothetical protein
MLFASQKASFSFAARQTHHAAKPCITREARFTAAKPQLHLKKRG